MRNVKAGSLASVFTDSTLSAFTQNAISKGVNNDSVIYIVCNSTDASIFGSKYVEGSHWIWAKGEIFGASEVDLSDYVTISDLSDTLQNKEDKSNKITAISSSSTNIQYPSAKCVYDEFTTTVTSQDISQVQDVELNIAVNTSIIDKTSDTSTNSFAIDPNKMYMFGTRTSLTITFNTPTFPNIVNEYMFQFTSGSTATTLNVPSSVNWIKDPDIQTNKKYAVSIENNLGIIGEWNNE